MTSIILPLLNGISLAAALVLVIRTIGRRYAVPLHAAVLLAAPLFYVVFATRAADWTGLMVELGGTAVWGGMALLGLRRHSTGILALGWALHPFWDVALHTVTEGAAYTPEGYVVACIGFDFLLAGLIARGWAGLPVAAPTDKRRAERRNGMDDRRSTQAATEAGRPLGVA